VPAQRLLLDGTTIGITTITTTPKFV